MSCYAMVFLFFSGPNHFKGTQPPADAAFFTYIVQKMTVQAPNLREKSNKNRQERRLACCCDKVHSTLISNKSVVR